MPLILSKSTGYPLWLGLWPGLGLAAAARPAQQAPPTPASRGAVAAQVDTVNRWLVRPGYQVLRVRNLSTDQQSLRILQGVHLLHRLALPRQADWPGFALNWIRPTPKGFDCSIEYGSRIYTERNFSFVYAQHTFYLRRIQTTRFDKAAPNRVTSRQQLLRPGVRLDHFRLPAYMPR